ncbi:MAG: tRNA uridine(34) 5-carboxymethylaminomethyl modification radical SAM/GNAT enzyme Elp3, partial [archaeon]|nr:tRNA uridine(34) 5-carboxymethylaminomethyl modification radical SAM/GNAT enzyme Elp3 [archaeon]
MDAKTREYSKALLEEIEKRGIRDREKLNKLKLEIGAAMKIDRMPSNPDILMNTKPSKKTRELLALLAIKPLRTLSGVAPIAIMTKPINCPHGTCIYCPGGPNSAFGNVPQSYTGNEPATMRAINNSYDPYRQTYNRLSQYYSTAHNPDKAELIIMGGTFPSFPKEYREEFITGAFCAANDFSKEFFTNGVFDSKKFSRAQKNLPQEPLPKTTIEHEHEKNERAKIRIVTLCIETKPDWCKEKEINEMLRLGATRVEIGAQALDNAILKYTNRGHTVEDTIEATRLLKDSGLKVTYHMMPGQPLSNPKKDVEMFKELFENPDFRPDGLKIYPCMVMPGTALAKLYENGRFTPLTTQEAADIIAQGYKYFPEYTRVHRVQRDIPTKLSLGGIDKNNLRQLVEQKMREQGIVSRDIRQRESGISSLRGIHTDYENVELVERQYKASEWEEVFISFEDTKNNTMIGFCRLRKP